MKPDKDVTVYAVLICYIGIPLIITLITYLL